MLLLHFTCTVICKVILYNVYASFFPVVLYREVNTGYKNATKNQRNSVCFTIGLANVTVETTANTSMTQRKLQCAQGKRTLLCGLLNNIDTSISPGISKAIM